MTRRWPPPGDVMLLVLPDNEAYIGRQMKILEEAEADATIHITATAAYPTGVPPPRGWHKQMRARHTWWRG